ncbi:MAG: hypothetical protein WCX88_00700 [Patescibacteria group bacterium]
MKALNVSQRVIAVITMTLFLFAIAWWSYNSNLKKNEVVVENKPEIEIIDQADGSKLVKNNLGGYEVSVPKDWRIDGTKTQFYTKETLGQDGGMKISCNTEEKEHYDIDERQKELLNNLNETFGDEIEIIKAEKITQPFEGIEIEVKNYFGNTLSVYFLKNDKEYACSFYFNEKDEEKLADARNKFLNNLKIYE